MATRTAPTVGGSPNNVTVSIGLIDASGDVYSDAYKFTAVPSNAAIEAIVAAYQAASQASVYRVDVNSSYEGDADPDNADVGQRNSVKDGINLAYKNIATLKTQSPRLVAPIDAVMEGNQDIPLVTSTELAALITAQLAALTGYSLQTAQFTERRERKNNPRIKV